MAQPQLYDRIGVGYSDARTPDPYIAAQVFDALGDASTVINIGAGTGNYEPTDRHVLAVEPNAVMIGQRTSAAPVVQAFAERLPIADASFDAALAMFTIHHWPDRDAGLREMGRVSRRQVALVYDSSVTSTFWLADYFDGLVSERSMSNPSAAWMNEVVNVQEERPMMVPSTCTDGFAGCYWNRPERYLDRTVQAGMSVLARLPDDVRQRGTQRLRAALETGEWDRRLGHLRELDEFDIGYRLVISES